MADAEARRLAYNPEVHTVIGTRPGAFGISCGIVSLALNYFEKQRRASSLTEQGVGLLNAI